MPSSKRRISSDRQIRQWWDEFRTAHLTTYSCARCAAAVVRRKQDAIQCTSCGHTVLEKLPTQQRVPVRAV